MWLTSWWVAWLLNFYGFSHTNCMVFYRTPWTRYGIPWNCIGTSGNPMAFHGTPRYSMEFQDIPWNSMAFHGTPWILHGTPWHSMELHGYSMGVSWNSMDFHRFPWNSMDFHRFPWRYFTRVSWVLHVHTSWWMLRYEWYALLYSELAVGGLSWEL